MAKEKGETSSGCFVELAKAGRWKIYGEEGIFSPLQNLLQISMAEAEETESWKEHHIDSISHTTYKVSHNPRGQTVS